MKTLPIALAGLALLTSTAPPPPLTLQGRVRDRQLDRPVADATVTLVAAGRTVVTDDDGRFSFGELQVTAPDRIVITHPDYDEVRIPLGAPGSVAWSLDVTVVRATTRAGGAQ